MFQCRNRHNNRKNKFCIKANIIIAKSYIYSDAKKTYFNAKNRYNDNKNTITYNILEAYHVFK